ncbi:hypothetical protein ACPPVW_03795 [Leifsonia sp. McL0607]
MPLPAASAGTVRMTAEPPELSRSEVFAGLQRLVRLSVCTPKLIC